MPAPIADRARSVALVATGALAVVALALPLPGAAIDLLQATHLIASGAVVALALRASDARSLGDFPSAVAGVAVLRLALEVAFARANLGGGPVGAVARSLGDALSSGSVGAGVAAFALLAVSQLVLVARGAERAAEVSARFALDALPGRQMAIDADLRSGAIDADAARRMREALLAEARLHGALDGALRFVKGDATVGIIAAAVNLAGGAVAGVLRDGLSLGDALAHYGALAVAQGIATRVPALAVATAAAIVVTRARWDAGSPTAPTDPPFALEIDASRDVVGLVALCDRELSRLGLSVATTARAAAGRGVSLRVRGALVATSAGDGDLDAWLRASVRSNAWRLLGVQETRRLLDEVSRDAPALARVAVTSAADLVLLCDMLQRLAREGVPLRSPRDLLEAFARHATRERDPARLTESARTALRVQITNAWAPDGALAAFTLDPALEDALRDHAARHPSEPPRSDLARDLEAAVREAAGHEDAPVIITDPVVRWYLRAALEDALPGVVALAHCELEPWVRITRRGAVRPM